ncbi:hypothetical protein O181_024492 [Austropuccinia psidii MF-1]|uniref:Uncharacterized protein n=1 Tax=Austropuccinia psidii MF-1 TaxID=1389203 RepID=A0A9Q3CJE6_9BASI|nr:hypothetical protein [Austropuccinia psidii MF-1]
MEEVTKTKNTCQNCGSTDHYSNNFSKAKEIYAIEKSPEEEIQEDYSESDSMGDSITQNSEYYQHPIEELLVGDKEETQLEIQEM